MSSLPTNDRLLVKSIKERFKVFCSKNNCSTCEYDYLPSDDECLGQWLIDLIRKDGKNED